MSHRITIEVNFYLGKGLFAELEAYLPRREAENIASLANRPITVSTFTTHRNAQTKGKRGSEEEKVDQNSELSEMDFEEDQEEEREDQKGAEEEQEEDLSLQSDSHSSDQESNCFLESLESPDQEPIMRPGQTKRQRGQNKDLVELPLKRTRRRKSLDQATELLQREQKERKRKLYVKRQIQAHEKATLDKILNQTGRKFRQQEEKQEDDQERRRRGFRTLGDVPKVIEIERADGRLIMTHDCSLFGTWMTQVPDLKMRDLCSQCGSLAKYKMRPKFLACSLDCYKLLQK